MSPQKIITLIELYEEQLQTLHVPKVRMDITRSFDDLSFEELLAHAHYLCDGVKQYALDPQLQRKTGSHLTSIQWCLGLTRWYTLEEFMNHNRP